MRITSGRGGGRDLLFIHPSMELTCMEHVLCARHQGSRDEKSGRESSLKELIINRSIDMGGKKKQRRWFRMTAPLPRTVGVARRP